MALILSIDTSLDVAAVALADDSSVLAIRTNPSQADHASWIHRAIGEMFEETGRNLRMLDAVAVTSGPGSYTGLRVGMATAKGLCFTLEIPLITENILKLTAIAVLGQTPDSAYPSPVFVRPMIDARRMEVFTALYDFAGNQIKTPGAVVLDEGTFAGELSEARVIFCGNGMPKWKEICHQANAVFLQSSHSINDFVRVASEKFESAQFAQLAYTEPDYFKKFYTGP